MIWLLGLSAGMAVSYDDMPFDFSALAESTLPGVAVEGLR